MNKIQKASITLMIIATGLAVLIILIPIFFDALTMLEFPVQNLRHIYYQ